MKHFSAIVLALLLFPFIHAWGQGSNSYYLTRYENKSVQSKPAKWHDLRSTLGIKAGVDRFDDDIKWFTLENGDSVQASHIVIDTIYVHKGQSVSLSVPDVCDGDNSVKTYQRWYDYRTNSTLHYSYGSRSTTTGDLLKPSVSDTYYRMANGYVGIPLSSSAFLNATFYYPTDSEFKTMFPNPATGLDNKYYMIACDVSAYKDYTATFDATTSKNSSFTDNFYEPTLAHRIIYYIVPYDGDEDWNWYAKNLKENKTKLTSSDESTNAYMEEFEIDFPYRRIPDHTMEMVALTKYANAYCVGTDDESTAVNISLGTNTAGINLYRTSLSGTGTIIYFTYPKTLSDKTQTVNSPGSQATILVKKTVNGTTYNLARYKLTFEEKNHLLTQTEVAQYEAAGNSEYQYRMPSFLNSEYKLLTYRNFDYDVTIGNSYGSSNFYPFPSSWVNSTYGFYDGSKSVNDYTGNHNCAEWGYYALTNTYVEVSGGGWGLSYVAPDDAASVRLNSRGNRSTYHLFIDASNRPGTVARIPFQENLCKGSELVVTAWVKCARWAANNDNAAILFSIMGVSTVNGVTTYTPIHRAQTGQIPCTYHNSGGVTLPGYGSDHNDWMQCYFTFVNESEDMDRFDSYLIQLDSNCGSTNGGDMYVDDIRVYLQTPEAKVIQMSSVCTDENTRLHGYLTWDRVLSRMGITDTTTEATYAIDIAYVDTISYTNKYNELIQAGTAEAMAQQQALDYAAVKIPGDRGGRFLRLCFKTPYAANTTYNAEDDNTSLVGSTWDGQNLYLFGGYDEAGRKVLAGDYYANLSPNRPYWLVISKPAKDDGMADVTDFMEEWGTPCCVKTCFMLEATDKVRVNGEIVDPDMSYCAGKVLNFAVGLKVNVGDKEVEVTKGVYFDWFFGSPDSSDVEAEFLNTGTGTTSVREALKTFRVYYPDADDINETDTPVKDAFTQEMFDLLYNYVNMSYDRATQYPPLLLHVEKLDVSLKESGLGMIIAPIQTDVAPGDYDISEDQWATICWSYIPIFLRASGKAPQAGIGINYLKYPDDVISPAIRIGYKQLQALSADSLLTVNLRGSTFVYAENGTMRPVSDNDALQKLYLFNSDDPEYADLFDTDYKPYDYPIGYLDSLASQQYTVGSTFKDRMKIHFDYDGKLAPENSTFRFRPKEGYSYWFTVYFEEADASGKASATCEGQFNVKMIVVPEYLVWNDTQKDGSTLLGNWNNDGNWKRATLAQMNQSSGSATYANEVGGATETDNGFTPMLFSKVIIPRGTSVDLYPAGHKGSEWSEAYRPPVIAKPTDNIMYDLQTFSPNTISNTGYQTDRFHANICSQIHIEPGAELVHSEYLIYTKAWIDYELEKGKWYLLATPMYEIVAGDFYTKTSGRETAPFFTPISYDTSVNNRYKPSFYQRLWANVAELYLPTDNVNFLNMAVKGNWSSTFQAIETSYSLGSGFSIKVQDITDGTKALVRLPKADVEYFNYDKAGNSSTEAFPTRKYQRQVGKFMTDDFYRLTLEGDIPEIDIENYEVPLSEANNNDTEYYLIGNPFMAHLDMDKFFDENTFLERKYWTCDNGAQTAAVGSDEGWVSTDGVNAFSAYLPPLRSFFVKKNEGATNTAVYFTSDMQVVGATKVAVTSTRSLRITASDGTEESSTVVNYSAEAQRGYEADKDAVLFLDGNLAAVPMVYTVADTKAVSINRTNDLYNIPIGTYGGQYANVTLTFTGVEPFGNVSLYDAVTGLSTPIYEGTSVEVKSNVGGRYFLRAGTPTNNEELTASQILVYTVGQNRVVVSSTASRIEKIRINTFDGKLLKEVKGAGQYQEIDLEKGNYIVTVQTDNGASHTEKVRVR